MGTTGSMDINLSTFGNTINAGTGLANDVMGGIRDQGNLIGLAIGLTIAIGLLFGLIFLVIGVIPKLIARVKGMKAA